MSDGISTVHNGTPIFLHGSPECYGTPRSRIVLLQALVSAVLCYQILFSPAVHLSLGVQGVLVLGLLLLVAGAMGLPARLAESRAFTIVLLLVDTTVTSSVIYISGDVASDLHLAYFLIILISASARTLKQKIGFSVMIAAAYGAILYLGPGQFSTLSEGHLIRITILLMIGLLYGVMNESLQEERQQKATLIDHLAEGKRAEQTLRESEERLRKTFEDAPIGMALIDVDYRYVKVNTALCQMLGYTREALARLTFVDVSHPDDIEKEARLVKQLLKGDIPSYQLEKRYIKQNEDLLWVHLTATVIREEKGKAQHELAMMVNITERKQVEQHLRQVDKLAALGTLVDGLAHQLNNPLFMISGYAQLASQKVRQARYESLADDMVSIQKAVHLASTIVEQCLAVTRRAAGGRAACEVNALVQQTLDRVANELTIRGIHTHTDLQADLPTVLAEPQELIQVFLALITNAMEAMTATNGRGTLTVRTALDSSKGGPRVLICVTDDGPGVATERRSRIFDPFFSTKPVGQGTGLGLPISHRIVTAQGGSLTYESAVGQGSTFIVSLPGLTAKATRAIKMHTKETDYGEDPRGG